MNIREWLETNQIEMLTDYPYCRVVKAESVLALFESLQAATVASSQDVDEFIAENEIEGDGHHAAPHYIIVDDLRAWMAGHVRVPEEADPLPDNYSSWDVGYNAGWNDCRAEMFTASKEGET